MNTIIRAAACAALLSSALAATSAVAGVVTTFTNAWAPTAANGWEAAVGGSPLSTFTVSVSPDGKTLTANLANNGDFSHPSFFLQNYSFTSTPLLPTGHVKYDYTIELLSPTGTVFEFDDFGHGSAYASGTKLTGTVDFDYTGGYFGYFGINIADFTGTASAIVTLTNLEAPERVPEPATLALTGLALAGALGVSRRKAAAKKAN